MSPGTNWFYTDQLDEHQSAEDALANLKARPWTRVGATTPNFGVNSQPFWFTFELSSPRDQSLLIEIEYALLDRIDFYVVDGNVIRQSYVTGDHYFFTERPVYNRNFLFPVSIEADRKIRILFRVQTDGSLQVPLNIWDRASHEKSNQTQLTLHTFFAAIMMTIALYNLMLFISSRDPVFFFYAAYVSCLAMTQLALRGYSYQFLWQESPYWNERSLMFFAGMAVVMGAMFAWHFLLLRYGGWLVRSGFYLILCCGVVQTLLSFSIPYAISVVMAIITAAIGCVVMFMFGLDSWRRGLKSGKFYTFAWTIFLIGMFVSLMAKLGLWPRTTLVEYGPELGAAIEVILLSFAVADRMNEERRKRLVAQGEALANEIKLREVQERALEIQNSANQRLEENVRARTLELQDALEELSTANTKLKMLSTIDGLTQVRNRRHFDETVAVEWARAKRNREPLVLILLDADHFKNINDTYGHLAGDECLKALARILENQIKRPSDCIARYGGEEFAIILADTEEEGALRVGERLRQAVADQPVDAEGVSIRLTISVGIGFGTPGPGEPVERLLGCADKALYKAKQRGRNQVSLVSLDEYSLSL
ncbi:sensor domain-containing diguanylate cyclase [Hahella ganghwensis]|uniref:sensor domain-containing diguanylate cyclase n=1 Tax=Hahella ganghwensis TaxID=286420 RepID=UPI0003A8466C|nr:diguanylate cyclase [Hahella ganghwensis]